MPRMVEMAPPPPPPPPLDTPWRALIAGPGGAAFVAVAAWLAAYALWTAVVPAGAQAYPVFSDIAFFPFELAAVAFPWRASRHPSLDPRTRRAWRIISAAYACVLLSNALNLTLDAVGRADLNRLTEIPSLAYLVLLLAGLLSFPTAPRAAAERTKLGLDIATVQVAGSILIWLYAIRPALAGGGDWLTNSLALAYPLGDLAILLVLSVLLLRGAQAGSREALAILVAALLFELFADVAYAQLSVTHAYQSGSAVDLFWGLGDVMLALSARVQWVRASAAGAMPAPLPALARLRPVTLVPYAAVALVFAMLLTAIGGGKSDAVPTLAAGAFVLTALVIARQIVSLVENAHLMADRIAQEARFRSLVQHSTDVITVVSPDGTVRYLSPSGEVVFGHHPDAMVGTSLLDVANPEDALRLADYLSRAAREPGQRPPFSWRLRHRDGSWRLVESVASNYVADPNIAGVVFNSRDVSDRQALEEQLRQAQKMEAIGRLAGGIAHDFNNLLMAIRANAELLRDGPALSPAQGDELAEIERSSARGAALTRQLLTFSRKQVVQAHPVAVDAVITGVQPMLRRLMLSEISLEVLPRAPRGMVKIDPGQLEQVVMNLVINARDAMPHGGTLTIESTDTSFDASSAAIPSGDGTEPAARPGPYVMIAVRDTGIGMDAATQKRLFEPFFTTKPAGAGTGLGLSTVFGIVTQAGGHVTVNSTTGRGSTFTIYLPRLVESDATAAGPELTAPAARGGETILLADDEDAIRLAIRRHLQKLGYQVIATANGREALDYATANGGGARIDLLLTDMVMPEVSGRELIDRLAALRPRIRVLCMSGFTDDAVLHEHSRGAGDAFIQKPFALDELSRRVRDVLDRRGDAGAGTIPPEATAAP